MIERLERGLIPIQTDGWKIFAAAAGNLSDRERDALITQITRTADAAGVRPIRRSRHAATFRLQFMSVASGELDLFVKVIDAPEGIERVKRRLRGTRSANVARMSAALNQSGFAAPEVLFYGRQDSGREVIVTLRSEGDGPLRTLKALKGALAPKRAILHALGSTIAKLHRAGYVHGDLTPFNVLIRRTEPPCFTFLDHERTRRAFLPVRRNRQLRNLVQLGRFDLPGITRTDRLRVLRSYANELAPSARRRISRRVATMLDRRTRPDGLSRIGQS